MLRDRKFVIAISVSVLLVVLIGVFRPREIDWTPSFSAADKIPYGSYVLYHSLNDIFGPAEITINARPVYTLLHKKAYEKTSLVFVQDDFNPSYKERKELLAFAASGNSLFISTGHFHRTFTDTLDFYEKHTSLNKTFKNVTKEDTLRHSAANFTNVQLRSDSPYLFKKDYFSAFYGFRPPLLVSSPYAPRQLLSDITVLGVDADGQPAFVRMKYGRGYIFIHNNPYAFTNYYMLQPRGGEYAAKCFSYLPQGPVIWDEYYKNGTGNTKTALSFILSRQSLRWAYFLSVFSLLLFIVFNVKRRQRIIPVIEPFRNASLEFTKTIGALYFNQGNHRNIALKKITYFMEFIRNRYNLDTSTLDEEFARKLQYKSGMSVSAIEHLLNVIWGIEKRGMISSTELIDLNYSIEYFKKHCQ